MGQPYPKSLRNTDNREDPGIAEGEGHPSFDLYRYLPVV